MDAPALSLSATDAITYEGDRGSSVFTFTVTRIGDTSLASSVDWSVTGDGGDAADAADFVGARLPSGTVWFDVGQTTATFFVEVASDLGVEADESFRVTLSNPVNGVLDSSTVVTQLSDYAAGGYGVTTNYYTLAGGGGTFTFNYQMYDIPDKAEIFVDSVLLASTDGFVSNGGTLTVDGAYLDAGDQVVVVITGDDPDTAWDYTVDYSGGVQTINYMASGVILNDDAGNQAPTLAVPAGAYYVDTSADDTFGATTGSLIGGDADADPLTYGIVGGTVVGGTVVHSGSYGTLTVDSATGAYSYSPYDAVIEGLNADADETFTVTVADGSDSAAADFTVGIGGANDAPLGTVEVSGSVSQGETLVASHTLSDAEGLGSVSWQWLRGTTPIDGANGADYTLGADDVGQTIAVRADYVDGKGSPESVTSAATAAVVGAEVGVVFTNATGLVVSEAGDIATFQVALQALPRHDVYVTLTANNTREGLFLVEGEALPAITLVFTAENWAVPQTATVVGVDDGVTDGNRSFDIETAVASEDLRYDGMRSGMGLPIPNISVLNLDDDQPDEWYGSSGDDYHEGGNGPSDLYGMTGRDEIYGGNGDDRIYGGYNDDVLYGEGGNDKLEGEQGLDKLYGGEGNDSLLGGTDNDLLYGEAGDDELEGSEGNDRLTAGDGNDLLTGGTGRDTLMGGAGNDTLDGSESADSMDGGNGADLYRVDDAADIVADSGSDGAIDTVQIMAYLTQSYVLGVGIDNAALDDRAENGGLTGNAGNNGLTGNASGNRLDGGAGNDALDGGGGSDTLSDGDGKDTVQGGAGNDQMVAGVGSGSDRYNGGTGKDTVSYINETADLVINLASGEVTGTHVGRDTLKQIENAIGGSGNDTLKGNGSDNMLDGGAGNDLLRGGNGKDLLTGGSGSDLFDFDNVREISTTNTSRDIITDFLRGTDKIDLSTIDANTATLGNDAFTGFISASASFSAAGQLQFKNGVLYGNTDADTAAEFALQLTGVTGLGVGDLVL